MPEPLMVWRLSKRKYAETAFSGEGGLYVAGRWTPKGYRAAYTSESLALASLEVFVHAETNNIPLVGIRAYLNDPIVEEVPAGMLPTDWQETTAYSQLQGIGERWLKNMTAPILKVPSAIVPMEYNYILNPAHPDWKLITESAIVFQFDNRMWKSL